MKIWGYFLIFIFHEGHCKIIDDAYITDLRLNSIATILEVKWDINGSNASSISSFKISIISQYGEDLSSVDASDEKRFLVDSLTPDTQYQVCVVGHGDSEEQTDFSCDHTTTSHVDPYIFSQEATPKSTEIFVNWTIIGEMDDVEYFHVFFDSEEENQYLTTQDFNVTITDLTPNTKYTICIRVAYVVGVQHSCLPMFVTTVDGGGECPSHFTMIGSKCYHVDAVSSWVEARNTCETLALQYGYVGDLAVLSDLDTEFNTIAKYMKENNYHSFWVGGFDLGHEGTWKWIDGTQLDLHSTHWHCNRPYKDTDFNCAIITEVPDTAAGDPIIRTKFIDAKCGDVHRALCQLSVLKQL